MSTHLMHPVIDVLTTCARDPALLPASDEFLTWEDIDPDAPKPANLCSRCDNTLRAVHSLLDAYQAGGADYSHPTAPQMIALIAVGNTIADEFFKTSPSNN